MSLRKEQINKLFYTKSLIVKGKNDKKTWRGIASHVDILRGSSGTRDEP